AFTFVQNCRKWSSGGTVRPDPGRFSQKLPMRTRLPLLLILVSAAGVAALAQSKQTLLMNRLGPSQMTLYIANGDGSGGRPLLASSSLDYDSSLSPDGHSTVLTSQRGGSGP